MVKKGEETSVGTEVRHAGTIGNGHHAEKVAVLETTAA
jgi:hypothetical protein